MPKSRTKVSAVDQFWMEVEAALRTLAQVAPPDGGRRSPASDIEAGALSAPERRHAVGLMRINHAGEIAAQALYRGQALTATAPTTKAGLAKARAEEHDHLLWCAERVQALGGRTSRLAPLWYGGAFALGALAGLAGDRVSLGFLAETERQVAEHLRDHLRQLPAGDQPSREVLKRMCEEEERHQHYAEAHGAAELPWVVRQAMRAQARVMKVLAYRW